MKSLFFPCVFISLISLLLAGCMNRDPSPRDSSENDHRVAERKVSRPLDFPAEVVSNGGSYVASDMRLIGDTILVNAPFGFTFVVKEKAGQFPVTGPFAVTCEAIMPDHNHGMNYEPEITIGENGSVSIQGMRFHMPGEWQVHIDVTENAVTERIQWSVKL
jgi:hypothetical protein